MKKYPILALCQAAVAESPAAPLAHYCTEITALDPQTGACTVYAGPLILATSPEQAAAYCQQHGLGYCRVTGATAG